MAKPYSFAFSVGCVINAFYLSFEWKWSFSFSQQWENGMEKHSVAFHATKRWLFCFGTCNRLKWIMIFAKVDLLHHQPVPKIRSACNEYEKLKLSKMVSVRLRSSLLLLGAFLYYQLINWIYHWLVSLVFDLFATPIFQYLRSNFSPFYWSWLSINYGPHKLPWSLYSVKLHSYMTVSFQYGKQMCLVWDAPLFFACLLASKANYFNEII